MPSSKKKVVYLLGSGATHAVVNSIDSQLGLLTRNVKDKFDEIDAARKSTIDPDIWNEAVKEVVDIEHLISVIESDYRFYEANSLREIYRDTITSLASKIGDLTEPNLYSILYDLYKVSDYDEELQCFLTLNYEDILERTIKEQFGDKIDYGIQLAKSEEDSSSEVGSWARVFKLHGSFSWLNDRPVKVKELSDIGLGKALWIPPGVDKRRDNYPFNLLWGKALEALLSCDVLRVVGCSLSRNDWGLIPLIYTAQSFDGTDHTLSVEVIDYPSVVERMKANYPYLVFKGPGELDEFVSYYIDQLATTDSSAIQDELRTELENGSINIMKFWLEMKVEQVARRGNGALATPKGYVAKFYSKE